MKKALNSTNVPQDVQIDDPLILPKLQREIALELSYVPTEPIVADGLTKDLTHVRFHGFVEKMRMT